MSKKPPEFTPPEKVTVSVCRNGAEISAFVDWGHAPAVLKALLDVFRKTTKEYPELLQELTPLSGGQTSYSDDWSYESKKKKPLGFSN